MMCSLIAAVLVVVESLSCVQLLQPHKLYPARLLCPCDFPGKNTGVGCYLLFQGTFRTQGWNLCLCIGRRILYYLATEEALLRWVF